MFNKSILAAGAVALFTMGAQAATLSDGDTGLDITADTYTFDESFVDGATGETYTFGFTNPTATEVAVTISSATVLQDSKAFFDTGASVFWDTAGSVLTVASQVGGFGTITFNMLPGASDTLNVVFGNVTGMGTNIDLRVSATLESIPLPAGALLMGTALAGFGIARRRRK